MVVPSVSASAHAGGRAQLYIDSASLTPARDGWAIATVLRDLDSGAPEPGFAVEVSATGPAGAVIGPLALLDPDRSGRYGGTVPGLNTGQWTLTLKAMDVPGGDSALPAQRTWTVELQAGRKATLTERGPTGSAKSSGGAARAVVFGASGVILGGLTAGALVRRHRR